MKKKICCGIAVLYFAFNALAASAKAPLTFFQQPNFPKTIQPYGTSSLKYIFLNNTKVTLPLTFSTSISSGGLSLSSTTCGATLTAASSCTNTYTFTAPANFTASAVTVTGLLQAAYNGRYPLKDSTIQFTVVPSSSTALEFLEQPTFPITVPSASTAVIHYVLKNNTETTVTFSFSATVGSGSISATGGTCGSSITSGSTCTKDFTFTAPTNAGPGDTTVNGTMSVNYTYNGSQTLTGTNPSFTITPAAKPSITVNSHSLMFANRDFGNASNYVGTLTITNNGTVAITSVDVSITSGGGNTITNTGSSGCTALAVGGTCTETFSSALPIDSDATISLTPHSSTTTGNALTVPVSALSVVALAPPTDTAVGLTLVNGCSDTSNDGGLVMIINNSSHTLTNIAVGADSGLSATITNSAFEENSNVYCNGNSLAANQYCEIRVASSAAAGTTGNVTVSGILSKTTGPATAHHFNLAAKVVSTAGSFPYTFNTEAQGGTIFVANNACNLVEVVSNTDQSTATWSSAATYCSGTISSNSDWRLMDLGPVLGASQQVVSSFYVTLLSGEANVVNNSNSPLANIQNQSPNVQGKQPTYWGNSINSSNAFFYLFGNYSFCTPDGCGTAPGNQSTTSQTSPNTGLQLYTRCVRAFTTG